MAQVLTEGTRSHSGSSAKIIHVVLSSVKLQSSSQGCSNPGLKLANAFSVIST
jgi:hypothetical protein